MYTATASATAATLAGEEHRGRVISIVTLRLTSSLVLGAPLGTAIGAALGWRATMWVVAALAVVVLPVIAVWLPNVRQGSSGRLRGRLVPLADRRVLRVLVATVVVFTGIYIPYTYISAVFGPATAGGGERLAILLLVFGVGATTGNLAAGYFADRQGPRRVILAVTLVLTAVFAVLPVFRGEFAAALPAVVVVGALSFSVTTPQQHRIIALAPEKASMVTSLYASALYLAISLSGVIEALGLRSLGAARLPPLAAAALTWWDNRAGRSEPEEKSQRGEAESSGRKT